ncbi:calcium-binding protein [Bosea sp. 685]|uniref:calcium-binding protein n=1 Tax=Bosea sp. 685 TaxID=3080057 RepID=UPI002892D2A9|nr:calcium-binding protein [Bosea sp. 685]WNJ88712.1 calcium-binding protein [Bosea sp. 685]
MLDTAASTKSLQIYQTNDNEAGYASKVAGSPPQYYIGINFTAINKLKFISETGVWVQQDPRLTLAHELLHFSTEAPDPHSAAGRDVPMSDAEVSAAADLRGDATRFQSATATYLNLPNLRQASYLGAMYNTDTRYTSFSEGFSYSEGNLIDNAIVGDGTIASVTTITNIFDRRGHATYVKDLIFGLTGDDTIHGGDGNDYLYGGSGNDTINGDGNDDLIYGGDGNDIIHGGDGNDRILGTELGQSDSSGPQYSDTLYGDDGDDIIWGGGGADFLYGGADNDELSGGDGDDTLDGGDGNDLLYGGVGNDILRGGGDADILTGEGGNDLLVGGNGIDTLLGGDGKDILMPGSDDAVLDGGTGDDWFWFDRGVERPFDLVTDYTISNGEAGDRIFWNGYALMGGEFTIIEEYTQPLPGGGTSTTSIGSYLGEHGIIYNYNPLFSNLQIILPTNEVILLQNFTNGMFGLNFATAPPSEEWGSVPRSNVVNNGEIYDFHNLTGRSAALSAPGSIPIPVAPLPDISPLIIQITPNNFEYNVINTQKNGFSEAISDLTHDNDLDSTFERQHSNESFIFLSYINRADAMGRSSDWQHEQQIEGDDAIVNLASVLREPSQYNIVSSDGYETLIPSRINDALLGNLTDDFRFV